MPELHTTIASAEMKKSGAGKRGPWELWIAQSPDGTYFKTLRPAHGKVLQTALQTGSEVHITYKVEPSTSGNLDENGNPYMDNAITDIDLLDSQPTAGAAVQAAQAAQAQQHAPVHEAVQVQGKAKDVLIVKQTVLKALGPSLVLLSELTDTEKREIADGWARWCFDPLSESDDIPF